MSPFDPLGAPYEISLGATHCAQDSTYSIAAATY